MSIFAGRFSGRTAVITGGASGLGLLAAKRRIVQEGGRVLCYGIRADAAALADIRKDTAETCPSPLQVNVGNHDADVAQCSQEKS